MFSKKTTQDKRDPSENQVAEIEFTRAILEAAPIGYVLFDNNLKLIDCNDTLVKQLKTTKDFYLNNFFDFSPEFQPDGLKSTEKALKHMKLALEGQTQIVDWMHKSKNGELFPTEVTMTRIKNNDKYFLQGFQYDLRNIKKMQKAIVEAQELTRAVTEASPIPYVLFDENIQAIDCNEVMLQLVGCNDKHYFLENYWNEFIPETQSDGLNSYEKAKRKRDDAYEGDQTKFEWVHRTLNGDLIPMENTLTQVTHSGKKLIISFKYDLRDTKKMIKNINEQSEIIKIRLEQQELLADISRGFIASGNSEEFIKEAIAKLGKYHKVPLVFIFSIDYLQKTAYPAYYWSASDSAPRIADFDLFQWVTYSFPERLPDCATMPIISCENTAADAEKYKPLIKINVSAFICVPLYVEGRLWGILSIEEFHKPRIWTDYEKRFAAMTSGTISGVIMRNIYNTMLKDALDKATVASSAKGQFLSTMSHEIRTPLNAIIGMTSIAKNAQDIERKNYALDKIEEASTHLLGVINDVLDMSKIEANKLELSSAEFNFEKMIQKAVNVVNFRVEEKHQKLTVTIDENIPEYLIGDDQRITQVITNLFSNAVKFTPDNGFINLDVRLLSEDDNNFYTLQFSVTDSGIGISVDQQERLFQSFQQAETSTARKFGGTGLGLAICKNIVELMNGKIRVESEVNKGSTFIFTIQIRRGEGNHVFQDKEGKEKQGKKRKSFAGHRILLAEDMEINREIVLTMLGSMGLEIDCAENGTQAVEMFKKNPDKYELIFMDVHMPEMDGYSATRQIRTIEAKEKKRTPIIAMTANVFKEDIEKCLEAGMNDHVGKPLDFEVIIEKLQAYLPHLD